MADKKMIPCRVCGKMFVPCAYCLKHSDTFRWRNFACSIECAKKYIADTIAYRESSNNTIKVEKKIAPVKNKSKKASEKSNENLLQDET